MDDVTQILANWSRASPEAKGRVVAALYEELRRGAARHLRGEVQVDLQPTALVSEAYVRLVRVNRMDLAGRTHFFGLAGRLMREVLVDEARRMRAQKRDRGLETRLTGDHLGSGVAVGDLVEVDDLITRLRRIDPVYADLVDARVFAGLTLEEAAAALDLPLGTAKRKWRVATTWLKEQLVPPADLDEEISRP